MAKVVEGFLLGTHYDLTFYMMDGNLYVRMKSSLSRKKVKYSPRFVRTMQSANELGRASKIASRVYWELSREQKKSVFVLYKKMTGVAKLALKYGKSEAAAEREVRDYLVTVGVVKVMVKPVVEEAKPMKEKKRTKPEKRGMRVSEVTDLFSMPDYSGKVRCRKRKAGKCLALTGDSYWRQPLLFLDG